MVRTRRQYRLLPALAMAVMAFWFACADHSPEPLAGPDAPAFAAARAEDLRAAIQAQERHSPALLNRNGVVGTAVGLGPDGKPAIKIFLATPGVGGIPVHR